MKKILISAGNLIIGIQETIVSLIILMGVIPKLTPLYEALEKPSSRLTLAYLLWSCMLILGITQTTIGLSIFLKKGKFLKLGAVLLIFSLLIAIPLATVLTVLPIYFLSKNF